MLWTQAKHCALVAAVAALVMLTNLGGPRLWDRDEPRNAGAAKEMLARHDLIVPWFNGELRAHKPVLLYWCIMASYVSFGINEFAARLPSALCAIGSALCVYRIGRRLFGLQAGVWAGIALATSLMFVVAGRAATPDSLLIFCTTLALMIYVCGTFRSRFDTTPLDVPPQLIVPGSYFPQHWPTVALMYSAMGLGVLAKGPVGLVLPTAVIGMFLLIVRLPSRGAEPLPWTLGNVLLRILAPFEPLHFLKTCWSMRPLTALFAATAVALPWYWAVGLATNGEFLRTFFFEHNLARATGSMEHHGGSIFFYPLAILIGFFPWSVFALPLAIDTTLQIRRRHAAAHVVGTLRVPLASGTESSDGTRSVPTTYHPGYVLAVCWVGVYVLLFSLARTKLPSYITPCYPALAMLVGDYFDRWSRQAAAVAGGWLVAAFGCLALVGMGVAVGVPVAAKMVLPGEEWLGLIGLIPLAGGVAGMGLVAVRSFRAAGATFAFVAATFATLLFALGVERVDRHQSNHELFAAIAARSAAPTIASYKILEPSWVFYGGRTIHEIVATRPDATTQAAAFLAASPDDFLITTRKRLSELAGHLPPGVGIIHETPYFLKEGQSLVLLGRLDQPTTLTRSPDPLWHSDRR